MAGRRLCINCLLLSRGDARLGLLASTGPQIAALTSVRHVSNKHYDIKWRKLRAAKVKKMDLPDFDEGRQNAMKDPDEFMRDMKKKGVMPYRQNFDRPIIIASTNGIFEPYVPPEGDGRSSVLGKEGAKQRLTELEKKGKSYMQVRKIRDYEGPDFQVKMFAVQAQEIYTEATKLLEDVENNKERLHHLVTEHAFPKMTWKLKMKTFRWNYIGALEPPRVVHCRTTSMLNKEDIYAQVTVRFLSQQTLALYDRFGRLMYGSESLIKDVLEYVVFEKHLSDEYGEWRVHEKIIPDWMTPSSPALRSVRQPPPGDLEEEGVEGTTSDLVEAKDSPRDPSPPTPALA